MSFTPTSVPEGDPEQGDRRLTAAAIRERILDAAVDVFGAVGYALASTQEVAARAGVDQEQFRSLYPDKTSLVTAVLQRRDARRTLGGLDGARGVDRFRYILEVARNNRENPVEVTLFAVLTAEATQPDHPAHELVRQRYEWAIRVMELAFGEARAEGHLRPGVSPLDASVQLVALWDGLQIQQLLLGDVIDVAGQLEQSIDLHLIRPLAELLGDQDRPATPGA